MAISRRKKLLREEQQKIYSKELKRQRQLASSVDLKEFKEYVPSRSYVRVPESIPSFESKSINSAATAKAATKEYSGEYVTGLATLHKSNIVPVGRDDDPTSYATMRRN